MYDGQNDVKAGALTHLAAYVDLAVVPVHGAIAGEQTQAGSLARRFGGEKRVIDTVQFLFGERNIH